MSLNRVCNRCLKVDTENFGSLQQCQKTNLSIYICFECTDICDYCNQRPSVILQNVIIGWREINFPIIDVFYSIWFYNEYFPGKSDIIHRVNYHFFVVHHITFFYTIIIHF